MNDPVPDEANQRLRTMALVSGAISSIFVAIQLILAFSAAPGFLEMYRELGSRLPLATRLLIDLGSFGIAGILLAVDIAAFVVMYRLARKYGPGLVFAPIALHAGLAMLFPLLLYLPMFRIVDLIQ